MLMFDDTFQLSEQYFTVLQLLRIFQSWIQEAEEGMADLRGNLIGQYESWIALRRLNAPEDEIEWPLDMPAMEANWDKVEAFFHGQVNSLKLRIERKKEEVESLRSGVCRTVLRYVVHDSMPSCQSLTGLVVVQCLVVARSFEGENFEPPDWSLHCCYSFLYSAGFHGCT
jgi:hypothetical protein